MGIDGEVWLLNDQHIVEMPETERRMYSKKISLKTLPLFYIQNIYPHNKLLRNKF
jgi:hypothetical protein